MRYFFDLHNDIDAIDEEGAEFADIGEARTQGLRHARLMAAESVKEGHLNLNHYIEVRKDGASAFRVTFAEAVKILPIL